MADEISEKNYKDLLAYLRRKKLYIEHIQFRAVLYAMNLLSTTDYNKTIVLKLVKQRFTTVTKKFVNDMLKDMCFVSNAKKKANKVITQEMVQEMVLFDIDYKNRVLREK